MTTRTFISSIPVYSNSKAAIVAERFEKYLSSRGLKAVYYHTGRGSYCWSYDLYIIPFDSAKPFYQKNCDGLHLLSLSNGYFVKGTDNVIINAITEYMDEN